MKLYVIIFYHKSGYMTHREDYVVKAILDESKKNEFFQNLNIFARDFFDYMEIELNDMSELEKIMI